MRKSLWAELLPAVVLAMAAAPVGAVQESFGADGRVEWRLEAYSPPPGGGDLRWVWAVSSFEQADEQGYLSQKGLLGFDCQRGRHHRSVPLLFFREKRGQGMAVAEYRPEWAHPPSPRMRQAMVRAVCARSS